MSVIDGCGCVDVYRGPSLTQFSSADLASCYQLVLGVERFRSVHYF